MRGFGGLVLLVLVVGAIVRFWWVLAAALAVVVTAAALWRFVGWLDRRLDARTRGGPRRAVRWPRSRSAPTSRTRSSRRR